MSGVRHGPINLLVSILVDPGILALMKYPSGGK